MMKSISLLSHSYPIDNDDYVIVDDIPDKQGIEDDETSYDCCDKQLHDFHSLSSSIVSLGSDDFDSIDGATEGCNMLKSNNNKERSELQQNPSRNSSKSKQQLSNTAKERKHTTSMKDEHRSRISNKKRRKKEKLLKSATGNTANKVENLITNLDNSNYANTSSKHRDHKKIKAGRRVSRTKNTCF